MSPVDLHARLSRWPLGGWLFARLVCFKAPYFASIAPRIDTLVPGRCVVRMRDRRAVHNHIGTVHAIALCNAAELAAGLATEASLPASMRWIPVGMTVAYVRKAVGTMTTTATLPAIAHGDAHDVPVEVETTDAAGAVVFRATVAMRVSPKPSAR